MSCTAFVTIGESPRDDILYSMIPDWQGSAVIQHGALDSLDAMTLRKLGPGPQETPFVTRMANGEEILVSKPSLMPFLQAAIDRAQADGAGSVVVLCTGAFPSLTADVPLIFPDRILQAAVDAVLPVGRIGVVMPHTDQSDLMRAKWETGMRSMIGAAASPYTSADKLAGIASDLEKQCVDLIVLDCMGFTAEMKATVQQSVTVPVILANRLVGRIVEELAT